jgi:tetratricopeptide (TPR) repeat protein
MQALVLAVALAAPPSQSAVTAALTEYMSALAVAQERWARMAQLTVDGKTDEAKALGRRLPSILAPDFGASDEGRFGDVPHRPDARAWAEWAHYRGQPALAARLYGQADAAGLAVDRHQRKQWFQACAEIGDVACLVRLAPEMTMTPADRGQLDALAAGTLPAPEAFRARRALGRLDSRVLALGRWALSPKTSADRIDRLLFVRDALWDEGHRLAGEALMADPALPVPEFLSAANDLIQGTRSAENKARYWELVASEPRVPKYDRERALAMTKLMRVRQGRPVAAEDGTAPTPQVGHDLLRRRQYKAALTAYRKAEARYWERKARQKDGCGNDDPSSEVMPYVLYQGVSLERMGRIDEAIAVYASVLLEAPRSWRRPLALHLIELYDAAGRLDVLERFLDRAEKPRSDAFLQTSSADAIRAILSVYRLEKQGDWRSLAAELEEWDRNPSSFGLNTGLTIDKPRAAAHALARHCHEALPLLPPAASDPNAEMRPWAKYTRELCAGGTVVGVRYVQKPFARESGRDADLPEVDFPRVAASELPDPIVPAPRRAITSWAQATEP